jgi:hypothetical protein
MRFQSNYLCETSAARGNASKQLIKPTVSFKNLNLGSKMIIFESILATFIESISFRGCWGSIKN